MGFLTASLNAAVTELPSDAHASETVVDPIVEVPAGVARGCFQVLRDCLDNIIDTEPLRLRNEYLRPCPHIRAPGR